MRTIELTQEEIDCLSIFIEEFINDEKNYLHKKTLKNVFNKLPDSNKSKMSVEDLTGDK